MRPTRVDCIRVNQPVLMRRQRAATEGNTRRELKRLNADEERFRRRRSVLLRRELRTVLATIRRLERQLHRLGPGETTR